MARILAVDDQPEITKLIKRVLKFSNHDVTEAESASEAIALLKAQPFALVVTDKNMPDASGFEVIAEARKLQPTIGCVLMTAYPVEIHQVKIEGFLKKPFTIRELETTISAALALLPC
jgi:CheY-like chemotaxis protein